MFDSHVAAFQIHTPSPACRRILNSCWTGQANGLGASPAAIGVSRMVRVKQVVETVATEGARLLAECEGRR
jgi:hypothetical protein